MTEEEAKTKACVAGNRGVGEWRNETPADPFGGRYYCIGSACMAWRSETKYGGNDRPGVTETDGYCGLAGKP